MPSRLDERDYAARYDTTVQGTLLPGTNIEVVREPQGRGGYRHALFDFDGTISLIREGWPAVMAGMMMEVLAECPNHRPDNDLKEQIDSFILRTMGKQTIFQMIGLADEVTKLGGRPQDPKVYKQRYSDLLMEHIGARREALRTGNIAPDELVVKGARGFLEDLQARGVELCLASGTDECFVKEEAELIGVTSLFGDRIYGAVEDQNAFSKAMVIDRIIQENKIDGTHLLGFGDGYVEIDGTKTVGGTGVGVATDESGGGGVDLLKRERLLGVGADLIVPDYRNGRELVAYLLGGQDA
jgi:phosphoglycolate phosphatase